MVSASVNVLEGGDGALVGGVANSAMLEAANPVTPAMMKAYVNAPVRSTNHPRKSGPTSWGKVKSGRMAPWILPIKRRPK